MEQLIVKGENEGWNVIIQNKGKCVKRDMSGEKARTAQLNTGWEMSSLILPGFLNRYDLKVEYRHF